MNTADIPQMVEMLVTGDALALALLFVLSFVCGALALHGLDVFDRWLLRRQNQRIAVLRRADPRQGDR
ncbi:MAG TPA: hypothetical protein VHE61_22970 [Opitutaceae bacterium]|nr:hypothetical protein [Opitutaceae bacterium]